MPIKSGVWYKYLIYLKIHLKHGIAFNEIKHFFVTKYNIFPSAFQVRNVEKLVCF